MTWEEAMKAMRAGEWVRRPWMVERLGELDFVAHRCSLPADWCDETDDWYEDDEQGLLEKDEWADFFEVEVDFTGHLRLKGKEYVGLASIGGFAPNAAGTAATDWEIFQWPPEDE
jgi:hypothetical protein